MVTVSPAFALPCETLMVPLLDDELYFLSTLTLYAEEPPPPPPPELFFPESVTVTLISLSLPESSSSTVIIAVPAPIAVITPSLLTMATLGSELVYDILFLES